MHGVIFDLDGTLVDSHLDFDQMRSEMGLPDKTPILEAMQQMAPEQLRRCEKILTRHEQTGAERATLLPGVEPLLTELKRREIRLAVVTRNRREHALSSLARLEKIDLFDLVISRDDGPVKPDPWAIFQVCNSWQVESWETVMIGDFHFDITAGRRAGSRTVLLAHSRPHDELLGTDQADLVLDSLEEYDRLLAWLSESP